MPDYTVHLAHSVDVYGSVTIKADHLAAAVEKIRTDIEDGTFWDQVNRPDWTTSYNYRIAEVQAPVGTTVALNIRLSERDEAIPLTAEEVLGNLAACRLSCSGPGT